MVVISTLATGPGVTVKTEGGDRVVTISTSQLPMLDPWPSTRILGRNGKGSGDPKPMDPGLLLCFTPPSLWSHRSSLFPLSPIVHLCSGYPTCLLTHFAQLWEQQDMLSMLDVMMRRVVVRRVILQNPILTHHFHCLPWNTATPRQPQEVEVEEQRWGSG